MKNFFTLFLGVLFVTALFAQEVPEGVIIQGSVAPVIDGEIDEVWAEANTYNIDRNFQAELPTLGASGETTWKALYVDGWFYLLLQVTDDVHFPHYISGGANSYEYDKPEIYFDVNYLLQDGLGCQGNVNQGHYQYAEPMSADNVNGTPMTHEASGMIYTYNTADAPNYIAEYAIPFSFMVDKDGAPMDLSATIGFDVTIIDRDVEEGESRKRAVWSNMGAIAEAWANMDDAGLITFDGAEPPIFIDDIILTGGAITEDGATFAVPTVIDPDDASSKVVVYSIMEEGTTGRATIDGNGVVSPILNGIIKVQAQSPDGFVYSNIVDVDISGQTPTLDKLNIIRNGFFDVLDTTGGRDAAAQWAGWTDASPGHLVIDGVSVHAPVGAGNVWNYQFQQNALTAIPNIDYEFSFVAWADVVDTLNVDFEDTEGNGYRRYGVTTSELSADGRSEWEFLLTTEPTKYVFDVNFDEILDNTDQKVSFMLGRATANVYIDSVVLISVADKALIPTAVDDTRKEASFSVYPNPASSKLHVRLSTVNTPVAIYNSIGVIMEEVVVTGTHHAFDVSRYPHGMYFVKADDSVVKFIR